MNKLICTPFQWTVEDPHGKRYTWLGSYLGRTPATLRTLRRFCRQGIAQTGAQLRIVSIIPGTSYTSQWIAR